MRKTLIASFVLLVVVVSARATRQTVVVEEVQHAKQVEGVVLDPTGAPIAKMTVTDRGDDWGTTLRSTETDAKGHFKFSRERGKVLYYLRFDHPLFNPMELKLGIDRKAPHRGITVKPAIGG